MRGDTELDNDQRWVAAVTALFVLGVLVFLLVDAYGDRTIKVDDSLRSVGLSQNVADSIFRTYVMPFEIVSMLLLAALVGAVAIARRD
jgi:NADH-quinone oxidoreductase subunit J